MSLDHGFNIAQPAPAPFRPMEKSMTKSPRKTTAAGRSATAPLLADLIAAEKEMLAIFSDASSRTDEVWRMRQGLPENPTSADQRAHDRACQALLRYQPKDWVELAKLAAVFTRREVCEPQDGIKALARMAQGLDGSVRERSTGVGRTADLLAAWKAQETIVINEEEKDDLAPDRRGAADIFNASPQTKAAQDTWVTITEALVTHVPANIADLALMVDFFAEQCEGGKAETYIGGKLCWEHLQGMVRALSAAPA